MSTHTVDDLLTFVGKIYDIALPYYSNDVKDANFHTMEWIRILKYGTFAFQRLLARPDYNFIGKVDASGITRIEDFQDPTYSVAVGIPHLFCTMNGVYDDGGAPTVLATNSGDIAGWGGDWCGFYGDYWNTTAKVPRKGAFAADTWAAANLVSDGSKYDFHIRDWIEDADGFNIATLILSQGVSVTLPQALQKYYKPAGKSGYKTRYQDFYNGRFGGKTESAVQTAYALLFAPGNPKVGIFKEGLIYKRVTLINQFNITVPSSDDQNLFCKGFDTKFQSLIAAEKAIP